MRMALDVVRSPAALDPMLLARVSTESLQEATNDVLLDFFRAAKRRDEAHDFVLRARPEDLAIALIDWQNACSELGDAFAALEGLSA